MGSAIITITIIIIIIIIIIRIITPSTPRSFGCAHTLHTAQLHVVIQSPTVRPTEERLTMVYCTIAKTAVNNPYYNVRYFSTHVPQQTIKSYKKICQHNRPPKQR